MNRETRRDPTPRIGRKDLQDPDRDGRDRQGRGNEREPERGDRDAGAGHPVQLMTNTTKRFTVLTGTALLIGASVSGCIYRSETEKVVPTPTAVVVQPAERVVSYPEGRWQLYGDGSSTSPHYWAWVPAGSTPPPPPPLPRAQR
jgi:hypothetical protein